MSAPSQHSITNLFRHKDCFSSNSFHISSFLTVISLHSTSVYHRVHICSFCPTGPRNIHCQAFCTVSHLDIYPRGTSHFQDATLQSSRTHMFQDGGKHAVKMNEYLDSRLTILLIDSSLQQVREESCLSTELFSFHQHCHNLA